MHCIPNQGFSNTLSIQRPRVRTHRPLSDVCVCVCIQIDILCAIYIVAFSSFASFLPKRLSSVNADDDNGTWEPSIKSKISHVLVPIVNVTVIQTQANTLPSQTACVLCSALMLEPNSVYANIDLIKTSVNLLRPNAIFALN